MRTEYEQLQLTVCTSLAAFVCGWWYLCRTNGCWGAEMVDSPRSCIYLPLIWSRQLDLWHCHMGTTYKAQVWYTVASRAFFWAFPWKIGANGCDERKFGYTTCIWSCKMSPLHQTVCPLGSRKHPEHTGINRISLSSFECLVHISWMCQSQSELGLVPLDSINSKQGLVFCLAPWFSPTLLVWSFSELLDLSSHPQTGVVSPQTDTTFFHCHHTLSLGFFFSV